MSRCMHVAAFTIISLLMCGGCATPEYYTPGGYSSTYHKRLSESETVWSSERKLPLWKSTWTRCRDTCLNGVPWLSQKKDRRDRHVGQQLQLTDAGLRPANQ